MPSCSGQSRPEKRDGLARRPGVRSREPEAASRAARFTSTRSALRASRERATVARVRRRACTANDQSPDAFVVGGAGGLERVDTGTGPLSTRDSSARCCSCPVSFPDSVAVPPNLISALFGLIWRFFGRTAGPTAQLGIASDGDDRDCDALMSLHVDVRLRFPASGHSARFTRLLPAAWSVAPRKRARKRPSRWTRLRTEYDAAGSRSRIIRENRAGDRCFQPVATSAAEARS